MVSTAYVSCTYFFTVVSECCIAVSVCFIYSVYVWYPSLIKLLLGAEAVLSVCFFFSLHSVSVVSNSVVNACLLVCSEDYNNNNKKSKKTDG